MALNKSDLISALVNSGFSDEAASLVATGIDNYVKTATVNSGIPVATTGSAAAQTGTTTGPGSLS